MKINVFQNMNILEFVAKTCIGIIELKWSFVASVSFNEVITIKLENEQNQITF